MFPQEAQQWIEEHEGQLKDGSQIGDAVDQGGPSEDAMRACTVGLNSQLDGAATNQSLQSPLREVN